jgi:pimeloyl-ACP methyl ester carboxylesterase
MKEMRVGDRVVAYEEWGDPGGHPVVLFHGGPGSRRFCPDEAATRAAGTRLITFDRPGYGGSTPQPGRRLADTAHDVDALLDHCAVDRCAFAGWSAGGPFAIVAAYALGERVRRLAIVSAPGPLDEVPGGWEQLGDYQRPTAEMSRQDPDRSTRAIARHMAPFIADPESFLGQGSGVDGPILNGPARSMLVAQVTEGLRQGAIGMAADMVAMWQEWGFPLRDLTTPTSIFHGVHDSHNAADARHFANAIRNSHFTEWHDAGHLGIVTHWGEVLDSLR